MLHAFLDGELDGAHEEVLFRRLSENADLRGEMQDNLAIRKAIQHDTEAFTPPAVATSAVFGALGFSIPSTSSAAAAAPAANSMLRSIWVSGGSAMLAVTAAVMLYMLFPAPVSQNTERVISSPATELTVQELPALSDLAVSTPVARTAAPPVAAVPVKPQALPSALAALAKAEGKLNLRPIDGLKDVSGDPHARSVPHEQVFFYDLLPTPSGLTLQARNVALRSYPAPAIVSQSESWFRNVNLGVFYALSDHHSIGVETGQEAFPQRFNGIQTQGIEAGKDVGYEQNPLAYWATAVYQFNGDALLPHVYPFVQLQAGGAFNLDQGVGLGPLGRAVAGLKLKPFDRIAFVVGAEGSVLMYKFQNNWFRTEKLGLTYGLSYEF
ncbi:hypothetical protein KQI65_08290 [bacterium]|nr:hypothetical protein [bacterium]